MSFIFLLLGSFLYQMMWVIQARLSSLSFHRPTPVLSFSIPLEFFVSLAAWAKLGWAGRGRAAAEKNRDIWMEERENKSLCRSVRSMVKKPSEKWWRGLLRLWSYRKSKLGRQPTACRYICSKELERERKKVIFTTGLIFRTLFCNEVLQMRFSSFIHKCLNWDSETDFCRLLGSLTVHILV